MSTDRDNLRDAYRDALAFARATLRNDGAGRMAVARGCDPADLVDAMTCLYLGVINAQTGGPQESDATLAFLLANVERLMPEAEE